MGGRQKILWLGCLFLMLPLLVPTHLFAAPYFEGKRITIVVGSDPGGGYDRIARVIAKHLPKHIPGKPVVLVENMPGAGSIIAANRAYNIAKPDGLTIVEPYRGLPFAELTKVEGVRFNTKKFQWIGSAATESAILSLRNDLPYKTAEDLLKLKDPIPLYATGPAATDFQFPTLLKEFAGFKFNLVIYPSSGAGMLAVERKEVEGGVRSFTASKPFIDRGLIHPVIRGRVSEPAIEKLPVDEDLATNKTGKAIMAMRSAGDLIGRPFMTHPATPPEIMALLRDGFARVLKDKELLADAEKQQLDLNFVPHEECLKVLDTIFNQPDDVVKEFAKYIKF